jgi:Outer membrane protein beta-barrel domain
MRKIAILFLFFTSYLIAQNDNTFVDNKYLEDQLYINLTYIKLLELPNQISQTGLSFGLGLGFIKDLPVNKQRNIGFGIGLGYGLNNYYFNVKEDVITPENPDSSVLKSNKIVLHTVEMPIEFRIRTSTAQRYNFWRIYPGFKMAYVFSTKTNLKQREDFDVSDVIDFNKFIYGITLSTGYDKWNFHVYYGLNELFTNSINNPNNFVIQDLRLGLIFYIL